MSHSSDLNLQKKAAIEKLQGERIAQLERIAEATETQGRVWKDAMEKVAIIDDQLHTIDPSLV